MQSQLSLKERRVALALSQNEVNRRCGFKPAFYANVERGTKAASAEQTAIINEVLGSTSPPPGPVVLRRRQAPVVVAAEKVATPDDAACVAIVDDMELPTTHPELARLSPAKLAETWTNRPAQLQVLKNIFHSLDHKVTRVELETIKEQMKGKPLSSIANVVLAVLGMSSEVEM